MTTKEQEELARETYRKFCAIVGPKLTSKIQHPAEDPSILPKGNHDRVRIRILPMRAEKRPVGFWHNKACYYEILVGPCKSDVGLCLGEVQFFRYANQARCGGSQFTSGVQNILTQAMGNAPIGFTLTLPSTDGKFHLQRRYHVKDFKVYPCQKAAEDLAWLIRETMPKLQSLS